jgi:peptide/nickel transport system ATP-binding protein
MLEVTSLTVSFPALGFTAVKSLSFSIRQGEILGVVGGSGSGKSITALAVMGLLPSGTRASGVISFNGKVLRPGIEHDWNGVRGSKMGMVFQEPMTCLNPVMNVGRQVCEAMEVNGIASGSRAVERTLQLFSKFGIEPPHSRFYQFPHQLSGGLRQRVMLAMAMACGPELLIADEPTTALDLTIQAQILDLLGESVRETAASLLLITHDLGVIARMADRVLVMYAGRVAEQADVEDIFNKPKHPYTRLLLDSTICLDSFTVREPNCHCNKVKK